MPQKTLTKKQFIKKAYDIKWFGDGEVYKAFEFWKENEKTINKFIENKEFSKADFDRITWAFEGLELLYSTDSLKDRLVNKSNINDDEFKSIFLNICQSYITLVIQFNGKIDKYLEYFDSESAYYKKMKALSKIRRFDGSKEEAKLLFKEISALLGSSIELDPAGYESCCKLGIECLDLVFPSDWSIEERVENIDKIKFICEYCDSRYMKALRNSEVFHKWFNNGHFRNTTEEFNLNKDGVVGVIDEILNERSIDGENREKIFLNLEPLFKEYEGFENDYKLIESKYTESGNNYREKYKQGIELPKDNKHHSTYLLSAIHDYKQVKDKLYGKDWRLLVCNKEELDDIIKTMNFHIGVFDIDEDDHKIILGCTFDVSEKEKKNALDNLKKCFDYEFKIVKLDDQLVHFNELSKLYGEMGESIRNLGDTAYNIYWKVYDCISELKISFSKTETDKTSNKNIVNNTGNSKREPDEDKNTIKSMQENVSELDSRLDEYKKSIDRYFSEIVELKKENNALKDLLKNSGISVEDKGEEDLKERRKNYRITVVGGSEFANKGFKNLQKNQAFMDKLEQEYHLKFNQFELKGSYEKQKDKKFAREIEDELLFGSTDFVIILQLDHETALFNLVNNGDQELRSRITCFGEVEEDGKTSKINQKFSYDKFDLYLEKALNKYELRRDNDLIGLN